MKEHSVIKTLKNHLLVANSSLNGTPYERMVVYVARHDALGGRGFLLNRPWRGPLPAANLSPLEQMLADSFGSGPALLFGGPRAKDHGFALHAPSYRRASTQDISSIVAVSDSRDLMADMENGEAPADVALCYGFADSRPGELEALVATSDWFVVPATPELLFQVPAEQRYRMATRGLGLNALNFNGIVGIA